MRRETDRHLIERLSWDEVARRLENGAAAILPIGAAAKQHGFHLPMNTDRVVAESLAARIATARCFGRQACCHPGSITAVWIVTHA